MKFRLDIQGLRAFAVLVVLFFHLGLLKNGYLGVDIFFVISGFLITGIVYSDFVQNKYSMRDFYIKRIRRILPLVFFIEIICLIVGYIVMLPDDYENLSQSVIATNFFANIVLQYITTGNYWDVVNEYKPLLHTWSLGVEEQYYLLFPLIFLFLSKKRNYLFPILLGLTAFSLFSYLMVTNEAFKFYLLPTRFFQISLGGIASIVITKFKKNGAIADLSFLLVLVIVFVDLALSTELISILIVILISLFIIFNTENSISSKILTLKPIVFIGTISFSIYMWHQVIISFYRYAISDNISFLSVLVLFVVILLLSVFSYYFIEEYFRRSKNISIKSIMAIVVVSFLSLNIASFYIYQNGGIVKDFPILSFSKNDAKKNANSLYNENIRNFSEGFPENNKINIAIIGDSYGRDWGNILLESSFKPQINLYYTDEVKMTTEKREILANADVTFITFMTGVSANDYIAVKREIKNNNIWIIGTKNFGKNNGLYYNSRDKVNYCNQKADIQENFLSINNEQEKLWNKKAKFFNIIDSIKDKNNSVNVFTDNCKLISQDCRHLTKDGAIYFAKKIDLNKFIENSK